MDEYEKLTRYDLKLAPRQIIRGQKVEVPTEMLRGDMICPICLTLLSSTSFTLECSHRFCKSCIEQSLRMNSNDCPSCRKNVTTRRSLREDLRYDSLISAIYGDPQKFEAREEKMHEESISKKENALLMTLTKRRNSITNSSPKASSSSSSSSRLQQQQPPPPPPSLPQQQQNNSSNNTGGSISKKRKITGGQAVVGIGGEDMLFVLRKHPCEPLPSATSKEYIKASIRLTMHHLSLFLLKQYSQNFPILGEVVKGIQIVFHDNNGEEHLLNEDTNLAEIVKKYKKENFVADLILHYKLIK